MIYNNASNSDISLECKDYVKFLGMLIDKNLTWKYHTDYYIASKISRVIRIIAQFSSVPLIKIYRSLIFPIHLLWNCCLGPSCTGLFEEDLYLTRLIEHRIASATAKFHEFRKIPTNGRKSARTRGRYMNAFVRSRLCYNIATWNNPDHFVKKLDFVWHRMLRKVVKNGCKRKPDSKAFIYSNKDLQCTAYHRVSICGNFC